jgi:type I restriction enzyme S subunit
MNRKDKMTLVPKLRFPEFKNNGAINFENGNVIFESISNKNHNSDLPVLAITQEHGAIPRDQINYNVSVTDKSLKSYKVVEIGDFIISLRSFQGGIEYSLCHGICSPAYIILRKKIPIVEQYYKHYFKTNKFIQDLNKDLEGIRDGKMVSYSQFSSILLPKPENKEQQKIADCLSSLDDLITAEDKKLEALKVHKKGLMQKLLPAEGKTVPEWRFPEFRGSGEWEETTLEKVADYENGKAHENEISEKGKYIVVNSKFISTAGEVKKYTDSANVLAFEGDILMVLSDVPNGRAIAKCYYVDKDQTYTVNQRVCRLTPRSVTGLLLFHIVNRNRYFLRFDDGVKQTNLKKDDVIMCPLVLPKDLKEQQKIASCLSTLEKLITAQSEKVQTLKAHKIGLMQGLFSSVEEEG